MIFTTNNTALIRPPSHHWNSSIISTSSKMLSFGAPLKEIAKILQRKKRKEKKKKKKKSLRFCKKGTNCPAPMGLSNRWGSALWRSFILDGPTSLGPTEGKGELVGGHLLPWGEFWRAKPKMYFNSYCCKFWGWLSADFTKLNWQRWSMNPSLSSAKKKKNWMITY